MFWYSAPFLPKVEDLYALVVQAVTASPSIANGAPFSLSFPNTPFGAPPRGSNERTDAIGTTPAVFPTSTSIKGVAGLIKVCEVGTAFFSGHFDAAIPLGYEAEEFLRMKCSGVAWESTNVNLFTLVSLAHLGRFVELNERLPDVIERATRQGDLLSSCCLRASYAQTLHFLVQDDPVGLRKSIAVAQEDWRGNQFEILHYYAACAETRLLLYENRIEDAWLRLTRSWRDIYLSQVSGFELVKAELVYLRARCALAMLSLPSSSVSERRLRSILRHCQRQLSCLWCYRPR